VVLSFLRKRGAIVRDGRGFIGDVEEEEVEAARV